MIAKYDSVNAVSPELAVSPDNLIDFYTPEVLSSMQQNGEMTTDFIHTFKKIVEENLDIVSQEVLYTSIASKTPDQSTVFDYYKSGLVPASSLKGFISNDTLDEMFLDEKLSIEDVLLFAKAGIIKVEDTDKYFTSEEIIGNIANGNLSEEFLQALDKNYVQAKLVELYLNSKCPTELFVKGFLDYDIVNLETLNQAFEQREPEIDLMQFITYNSNPDRIKELFTNYHISYEDLFTLLHNEIIDKKTFDEIKSAIDKAEFYNKLSKTKRIAVSTNEKPKSNDIPIFPIIPGDTKQSNIDFDMERSALMETFDTPIFGIDSMPVIDSHNTVTGNPTSLNNYLVIPVQKYDLVIFEKFAPGNNFFIMPYQQADYFLHGNLSLLENYNEGIEDTANRSKKTLRQMESVQACPHSKHFWKHVIDKSVQLSEQAKADLKPRGRYSPLAKKYMESISKKYDENLKASREKGD